MSVVIKYTNDDWDFQLKITNVDTSVKDVSGAEIKVAITNDRDSIILDAITLVEDANWATGSVMAIIPRTSTGGIPSGDYLLEVQVDIDGIRKTYGRVPFSCVQGVIL